MNECKPLVVGGDPTANTYAVRIDKNGKTIAGIPRVDLCFDSEDPVVWPGGRCPPRHLHQLPTLAS